MSTQNQLDDTLTVPETAAPTEISPPQPKQRRGFGAMDRAQVRAIARKGGVAAHARGTAHRYTSEEARIAGSKGGRAPHKTRGRTRAPKAVAATETATA
jgi:general stress protein YciG